MSAKIAIMQERLERRRLDTEIKERLIGEVAKRPAIWDKRLAEHRDRYAIDAMWDEVANEMTMLLKTKEDCKRVWKNLYDHFRNLNSMLANSGSGRGGSSNDGSTATATKTVKWVHFKDLLFLKEVFDRGGNSVAPVAQSDVDSNPSENANIWVPEIVSDFPPSSPDASNGAGSSDGTTPNGATSPQLDFVDLPIDQPSAAAAAAEAEAEAEAEDAPPSSLRKRRSTTSVKWTTKKAPRLGDDPMTPIYEHLKKLQTELNKAEDDVDKFGDFVAASMRKVPEELHGRCQASVIAVLNAWRQRKVPKIVVREMRDSD